MCAELRGNELCDGEGAGGCPKSRGLANQERSVCCKKKAPLCLLLPAQVKAGGGGELFSRSLCVCACMYMYVVLSIYINVES